MADRSPAGAAPGPGGGAGGGAGGDGDRPDLRLVPVALAAWAGAWCGTSGQRWPVLLAALAFAAMALVAWRRRSWWAGAVLLVGVGTLLGGGWQAHQLSSGPVADLARQEAVVETVLSLTADPTVHQAVGPRPAYLSVRAATSRVSGRGVTYRARVPVLLVVVGGHVGDWARLPVGSRLVVLGRWRPPDPGSDVAAIVLARGQAHVAAAPNRAMQVVERVRGGLRAAVQHRRPEQRAIVPALVLGDTSGLTDALQADFRTTGLTHLTAVSGENLTLLLASVLWAARWLGVRGWWLRLVGLLGVAVFVALCRTEPSVLRAAAMGLVALAALGAGGRGRGPRNLAVAMLALLLLDPWLARSVGFGLSVLASAGIVWWSGRWSDALARWLPRVAAEAVTIPLAANLATLPVVASISGRVSVVGVLANAVAGPFVGPATVLGFAAAWLGVLWAPLAAAVGFGAAWCAQLILWTAHAGAALPGASWQWPTTPAGLAVLAVGVVVISRFLPWVLRTAWAALPLAVLSIGLVVRAPPVPGWPPPGWVLVACDVGQGDGLVVRVGDHQAVLVDAGPDPVKIDDCLRRLAVTTLPLVVLTHFHADHVNGLPGALRGRRAGRLLVSPLAAPRGEAATVAAEAAAIGLPTTVGGPGTSFDVGASHWQLIGPVSVVSLAADPAGGGPQGNPESSAENDASLVAMVTVSGVRVLLTGDAEPSSQEAILRSGVDLHADVLKIPHHGSARQDPAFFAATGAHVAIASAGLHNDYGHPAPRTVALVRSDGMTLLRTDLNGSVAVTVADGRVRAYAARPS